ncbi:Na+-dependent transporter [Chlorogloeopsis sp. ULAP02]|uniref:bile acid:sodium symporter family protein n=1 Tax=Chlorogloeopsis sp. ULAP02 TaxID=3107926 RepID=UPI003135A315
MNMVAIILLVLKASIILSVFAIGLKATFADATFLFRRPSHLFRALLSMNVLMPLIALAIDTAFDLHPAVKIALVAISVSPIPPILPNKALKAGGKEGYTIGLLVALSALSIFVIPIAMEIFERITGISLAMQPRSVSVVVLTTILVPLLVGIAIGKIAPTLADRAAKPISVLGSVLLVLSALPILIGSARTVFSLVGDGTIFSLAGFALIGFIIGHLLGGPELDNRSVLALATASRHPAVAIAIAHANFPEQTLAGAAVLWYLILSGIVSAFYLAWVKRQRAGPVS